jgi:hypothetical protein
MRYVYLFLVIIGAILPWMYFYSWFSEHGWALGPMVDAWYVNDATSALVYDLTIAAVALTLWALVEAFGKKDWWFLLVPLATFGIGVSCGLPLALFLHTRPSRQAA